MSVSDVSQARLDLLVAVARGEVTGEASRWWRRNYVVTAMVVAAQRAGLVEDVAPPAAGKVTARMLPAGRSILTQSHRCCRCGVVVLHILVCEHVLGGDFDAASMSLGLHRRLPQQVCTTEGCPAQALCAKCWEAL